MKLPPQASCLLADCMLHFRLKPVKVTLERTVLWNIPYYGKEILARKLPVTYLEPLGLSEALLFGFRVLYIVSWTALER